MSLSPDLIYTKLNELSIHFLIRLSIDELEVLVKTWHEDLGDLNDQEFDEAVNAVRSQNEFFPKTVQIRKKVDELRQQPRHSGHAELPTRPCKKNDEQIEKNKRYVRDLLSKLKQDKDIKQHTEKLNSNYKKSA